MIISLRRDAMSILMFGWILALDPGLDKLSNEARRDGARSTEHGNRTTEPIANPRAEANRGCDDRRLGPRP